MTKEEVLAKMSNHSGEVRNLITALQTMTQSVVKGSCPEPSNFKVILQGGMESIKNLGQQLKDIVDEWPED